MKLNLKIETSTKRIIKLKYLFIYSMKIAKMPSMYLLASAYPILKFRNKLRDVWYPHIVLKIFSIGIYPYKFFRKPHKITEPINYWRRR